MNTRICLSSGVVVCNSFKTYGKIPTDKAYNEKGYSIYDTIKNLSHANKLK
ncbi:hypothetical protein HanPSC8_Chr10g0414011 [Helianthus annuus]|nr:hypothetical protein HanPSC8_Chr10g0414011 [Helianthus annuus]